MPSNWHLSGTWRRRSPIQASCHIDVAWIVRVYTHSKATEQGILKKDHPASFMEKRERQDPNTIAIFLDNSSQDTILYPLLGWEPVMLLSHLLLPYGTSLGSFRPRKEPISRAWKYKVPFSGADVCGQKLPEVHEPPDITPSCSVSLSKTVISEQNRPVSEHSELTSLQ